MPQKQNNWDAFCKRVALSDQAKTPEQRVKPPTSRGDMKAVIIRDSVRGAKVKWVPR